jgi:hypothetical protein
VARYAQAGNAGSQRRGPIAGARSAATIVVHNKPMVRCRHDTTPAATHTKLCLQRAGLEVRAATHST